MDLADFIEARLAEDEAAAREASTAEWYLAASAKCECCQEVRARDGAGSLVCTLDDRDAAHVGRHDPARALREVAALRTLAARWVQVGRSFSDPPAGMWPDVTRRERTHAAAALASVAAIWSYHPDYDTAWAL